MKIPKIKMTFDHYFKTAIVLCAVAFIYSNWNTGRYQPYPVKDNSVLVSIFFWQYEKSFYENNPTSTQEEFDNWLRDLLTNYLPYKMMSAPIADEAQAIQEWKDDYENA